MANGSNGKKNGKHDESACVGCHNPRWRCGCAHLVLANFLFGLGLLALLFAWIASSEGRNVLGFTSQHLFSDAIAFMIAAVFFKRA